MYDRLLKPGTRAIFRFLWIGATVYATYDMFLGSFRHSLIMKIPGTMLLFVLISDARDWMRARSKRDLNG